MVIKRTHIDRLLDRKGITKKQHARLKAVEIAAQQQAKDAAKKLADETISKAMAGSARRIVETDFGDCDDKRATGHHQARPRPYQSRPRIPQPLCDRAGQHRSPALRGAGGGRNDDKARRQCAEWRRRHLQRDRCWPGGIDGA